MERFDEAIATIADKTATKARFDNNSMEYCLVHLWAQQEIELEAIKAARAVINSYTRSAKKRDELLKKVLGKTDIKATVRILSKEAGMGGGRRG